MSFTNHVQFFRSNAGSHFSTASKLFGLQFDLLARPYYSGTAHGSATAYPLCHTLKTLMSAGRIIKGCLLLLGALFENPMQNIPRVFAGICLEVGTLLVNMVNIAASCVSLLTRSLATLFNFGYTKNQLEKASSQYVGATNVGLAFGLGIATQLLEFPEAAVHQATVNLSQ